MRQVLSYVQSFIQKHFLANVSKPTYYRQTDKEADDCLLYLASKAERYLISAVSNREFTCDRHTQYRKNPMRHFHRGGSCSKKLSCPIRKYSYVISCSLCYKFNVAFSLCRENGKMASFFSMPMTVFQQLTQIKVMEISNKLSFRSSKKQIQTLSQCESAAPTPWRVQLNPPESTWEVS